MIVGDRGPVVVVSAAVCARLERTLVDALAAARRRGERVPADVARVIGEVTAAAAYHRGDPLPEPATSALPFEAASDDVGHDDWLTVAEAAQRLACRERNVRYLAVRHGLGRKVRGRWLFDPDAVDELARRKVIA